MEAARASNQWEIEHAILKEIEAARNADHAELSLEMINTTFETGFHSPWFHHLKARALQKLDKLEEAIYIWENLSTHEIEGFSENVRSALKEAKVDQALAQARQQEAIGSLDLAIESLASTLLNDPDQITIETSLKAMLRKRRHGGTMPTQVSTIEDDHELDLNHIFTADRKTPQQD